MKSPRSFTKALVLAGLAGPALSQSIPVVLDYNFNGIVHAGELAQPDDPNGYRSISDRGLDFTAGVPVDALLSNYQLVSVAGALDVVHLGNRNTVDNSSKPFDAAADGDNFGIQPNWLPVVDQTGPQTTLLPAPGLPIIGTTEIAFLYQISNGGGSFDVTFQFQSGGSFTATLNGNDWFGGPYPGTAGVDNAFAETNLSVTEGRVDMGAFDGELVTQLTFSNRSNLQAGYAILACNFDYPVQAQRINRIPLNYNFNGIVHAGEAGVPDDANGYRSISDRGLDFSAGVPADALLDEYDVVATPGALDIVHLGNRNTVNGSGQPFDLTADGDDIGVQPAWLSNPDQTGPQLTTLAEPILMDATSSASVLFLISNGGGAFDVEFQFQAGAPFVATISGGDWAFGNLPGTGNRDAGLPSINLAVNERSVDLSAQTGRILTGIAFQNRGNLNAGYAILGANVSGCIACLNGQAGSITNLGGGVGATMAASNTSNLGCDLRWTVNNSSPSSVGVFAIGFGTLPVPLSLVDPDCGGTVYPLGPVELFAAFADPSGSATFGFEAPTAQSVCGAILTGQHVELAFAAPCPFILSDAIEYRLGN